jgi:hypothetical protein
MMSSKLSLTLASSALLGLALFIIGLSIDAYAVAGFSLASISLVLLATVEAYAPHVHRFEPAAVPAPQPRQRLPLAA